MKAPMDSTRVVREVTSIHAAMWQTGASGEGYPGPADFMPLTVVSVPPGTY